MEGQYKNNSDDLFSQLVRTKLEGHELLPDDRCWPEIEQRLNAKKPKAVPLWAWLSGAAVGAAAVIMLLLTPPAGTVAERPGTIVAGTENATIPLQETALEAEGQPAPPIKKDARQAVVAIAQTQHTSKAEASATPAEPENAAVETVVPPPAAPRRGDRIAEPPADEWDDPLPPTRQHNSRKGKWLVAAAVSTGAQTLSEQKDMLAMPAQTSSYLETDADNAATATQHTQHAGNGKNFPKATHLPPISAGLRVRKDFGKHFAIESGLTYTYLHSNFNDDQIIRREAQLNMHYLGIPLNAVVYLVNRPKWDVYFLAGGMAEKGLQASYTETEHMPGAKPKTQTAKGRIAGVQWSIGCSFGISYRFYEGFSVYFEPNAGYYFDNGQPLSARTEQPLIVGLNAGIRYRFK